MKAVVKYGQKPDRVELRDVAVPKVRPGTVLLEVKAAGVCGWDIEMWRHHMANPVTVPVIQGHEFSGVIAEVGDRVDAWAAGERAVSETSAEVCGSCRYCHSGEYQVCPDRKGFGYGVDGAFARYVVVRQEILHRIPEELSFEEAALTEPLCVVHHALADRVRVARGDTVAVIGPGPIGLASLQMAGALGAARRILVGADGDAERIGVAERESWADDILTVGRDDVVEAIMCMTDGEGADVVVDAAGNAAALHTALLSVRKLGQVVKVGWGPKPYGHSLDDLLRRSATLAGTFGHNRRDWEAVLGMLGAGAIDARAMISQTFPMSRWREAFELAESRRAVKVVLIPDE